MNEKEEFSSAVVLKKARQYIAEKRNLEYIKKSENAIKEFLQNGFTIKEVILFYKNEIGITIPLALLEKYVEEKKHYFYKAAKKNKSIKKEKTQEENTENTNEQEHLSETIITVEQEQNTNDNSTHQSENIGHDFSNIPEEKNYAS